MIIQGLVQYLKLKLMPINLLGKRVQRVIIKQRTLPIFPRAMIIGPAGQNSLRLGFTGFLVFFFAHLSNPYLYKGNDFKFILSFFFLLFQIHIINDR